MAKDNTSDIILKLAAIVGIAWVAAGIAKLLAKQVVVYSCPVCNTDITYGETPCHNCNSALSWQEVNDQKKTVNE